MDIVFENLYMIIIIMLQSIVTIIAYIRTMKSGEVISKHRYKSVSKYELAYITILIITVTVIVVNVFDRGYMTSLLLIVYAGLVLSTQSVIIVTKEGFYCSGRYTKWSNVVSISTVNPDMIQIKRLTMIFTEMKIRELENKELFLRVVDENYNRKS